MKSAWKIGIDLGGTKTETILLDENGLEKYRKRVPTQAMGYEAILASTHKLILQTAGHVPKDIEWSVGIGIPGTIHPKREIVQMVRNCSK